MSKKYRETEGCPGKFRNQAGEQLHLCECLTEGSLFFLENENVCDNV